MSCSVLKLEFIATSKALSLAKSLRKELEDKLEIFPGIIDKKLSQNFEDPEFGITREVASIIYCSQNKDAFSSGMDEISLKKFSPVMQLNNILDHRIKFQRLPPKLPWLKAPNIPFMMTMARDSSLTTSYFAEEEEELIDIFNSNSTLVSNYPNFKIDSYNEKFHFVPIATDASYDNRTDEDDDKQKWLLLFQIPFLFFQLHGCI
ncbi:hypothetical protein TNIN_33471 [Trichonephila inaurata madagascariensis]|uniref:Uncharacterized protein n=1 Tax=Trichonephila inaurata madagascariensis TaxID=2747483 RepID=A0A8X7CIJ9_9ARAC|nr:hypothetical protein TNIN_33471 [Trichonephila inaurata madagascariensis]